MPERSCPSPEAMPERQERLFFNPRKKSPAPGYRSDSALGTLVGGGNGGYNYSSSVSSSTGICLYFHVEQLNLSYTNFRGSGLQLRCLSE